MQTAKHWSLAPRWPPSPCRGTHARVAVSRPLIARQLRTGSSRHGGMGDFVHAAVTCYILINSPAGKKYKSNHVCNNFSFFIHRETLILSRSMLSKYDCMDGDGVGRRAGARAPHCIWCSRPSWTARAVTCHVSRVSL